ncbi:MAG: hypothetical protein AB8G05_24450 [Oligoflexales bacterium]
MKVHQISFSLVLSAIFFVSCSKQEDYNHVSKAEGSISGNENAQKIAHLDQDDPDNTNFIVGNGNKVEIKNEKMNQRDGILTEDPSLFLTLNGDARAVTVYIEGYPDQKVVATPAYLEATSMPSEAKNYPETNMLAVNLSGVEIPKDTKISLIILGDDIGRKTRPLDLSISKESEAEDVVLVETSSEKLVPNFNVELGPLQTVSGNLYGSEIDSSDLSISVAGTKLAVNKLNDEGQFAISGVPPGGELKLEVQNINQEDDAVLLPFSSENSGNIENIETELRVRSVCDGFLRMSVPRLIDFPQFKAYEPSTADASVGFKNKFEFKSKSTFILTESRKMAICDMKIFLFPQLKNYFYSNKLLFAVNDNLLYTQMKEKNKEFKEPQGVLSFLGLRSIPPIFEQRLWQTGLDLLRMVMFQALSIFGLLNEPLVIGIKDFDKMSITNNIFRSKQLKFDIYCDDTPENCSANIDKISMELDLANTD